MAYDCMQTEEEGNFLFSDGAKTEKDRQMWYTQWVVKSERRAFYESS